MIQLSLKRCCPYCLSREIHRSRRQGISERCVFPLLLLRPFRCVNCNSRYVGLFFAARIKEEMSQGHLQGDPAKL
jgi:hypothetical protein